MQDWYGFSGCKEPMIGEFGETPIDGRLQRWTSCTDEQSKESIMRGKVEDLEVTSCVWHRNGISGIGFYAMEFKWKEEGYSGKQRAIATVDYYDVEKHGKEPYDPGTRVLMMRNDGSIDTSDTMRGDYFHEALVLWIRKNKK
jgi:hypothetical protein